MKVLLAVLGVAVPLVVTVCAFLSTDALQDAWYWIVGYNIEFSRSPLTFAEGQAQLLQFIHGVGRSDGWMWLVALIGAVSIWNWRASGQRPLWLLGWLSVAVLSLMPGRFFLPYYALLLAPPLAVLAAVGIMRMTEWVSRYVQGFGGRVVGWGVAAGITLSPLVANAQILRLSPEAISRQIYGANPFVEAAAVAQYVAARTAPSDKVLIVGSEPEMLFYARRRSATKYVFFYPLTSWVPRAPAMHDEFFAEIERERPRYVVYYMKFGGSLWMWSDSKGRSSELIDRLKPWLEQHYALEAALVSTEMRPPVLMPMTRREDLRGKLPVALVLRRRD